MCSLNFMRLLWRGTNFGLLVVQGKRLGGRNNNVESSRVDHEYPQNISYQFGQLVL